MRWFVYGVLSPIIVRWYLHTDMQILQTALLDNEDGVDERDNVEEVGSRWSFEWLGTNA